MRRALTTILIASTCAGCVPRSVASQGSRELATTPPCAARVELDQRLIHAVGCVALIDGSLVSPRVFNAWAVTLQMAAMPSSSGPSVVATVRRRILKVFVDGLLLDLDIEAESFSPTEAEIAHELDHIVHQRADMMRLSPEVAVKIPPGGAPEIDLTYARRLAFACRDEGCDATDAEVRAFYDDNIGRFRHADEVEASHIIIRVDSSATQAEEVAARRLVETIAKSAQAPGADFAALAKAHSQGPTAPKGGALGFFPRGRMVKAFEDAAFSMGVGEVSGPIRTRFGWHILYVSDRRYAHVETLEDVREDIERSLGMSKRSDAYSREVVRSRERHAVEERSENVIVTLAPVREDDLAGALDE